MISDCNLLLYTVPVQKFAQLYRALFKVPLGQDCHTRLATTNYDAHSTEDMIDKITEKSTKD